MYEMQMGCYFKNTSTKYTTANLLEIREWVDLLDHLGDDRVIGTLIIEQKDGSAVLFTQANSQDNRKRTVICASRWIDNMREGEVAEISSTGVVFSNYEGDERVGEELSFSSSAAGTVSMKYHLGSCSIVEDDTSVCVYFGSKKYGRFVDNYQHPTADCVKGYCVDNKYHGEIKTYRKNASKLGKLKKVENFIYGMLHGSTLMYHENGSLASACTFVQGRLYGKISDYDHSGKICGLTFAIFDRRVSESAFLEYDKKYGKYLRKLNEML
jgi:hypothetical protein